MNEEKDCRIIIKEITEERDLRYKYEAYIFIIKALNYTLDKIKEKEKNIRHVTGQELSIGIKDYALTEFGPTVKMVFDHWGIKSTIDFGNIVYNLIEVQLMNKTKDDRLEDFKDVFDLEEVFVKRFKITINK